MNTNTQLSTIRLRQAKRSRYNPLTSISDATQIARKLDAFEVGYLRDAVNIWDTLEQRDDLIRAVVSKRKKAAGRQGWAVLIRDSAGMDPERRAVAEEHAAALRYFYENLRCENALDRAERGGFKLLAKQMMDAVGKRFAVHEIVWSSPDGPPQSANHEVRSAKWEPANEATSRESLDFEAASDFDPRTSDFVTATFRFVQLSFFENTTGALRFLESESAVEGMALEPGAWMVTVGEGLMMATASAWILKNLTLNDWLMYSERNGRPGLRGITAAAPDSDEWKALETSLADILAGSAVIHSSTDDIKVIDLAAGGQIPFPDLVDRIDRMIAALWRGADLSTLSRDRGYGASLQEKETCLIEEDDAEMLTETLNEYVDAWVIRHVFGDGVKPLAGVKVLVSPKECTTADIQIDEFLVRNGAMLSVQETMSRYGRAVAKAGEPVLRTGSTISELEPKQTKETKKILAHNAEERRAEDSAPYLESADVGPVPPPGAPDGLESNAAGSGDPAYNTAGRVSSRRESSNGFPASVVEPSSPSRSSRPSRLSPDSSSVLERRAEDSAPYLESAAKDGISVGPVPSPGVPDGLEPNAAAGSGDPAYSVGVVPSSAVAFQNAFDLLQSDWVQLSPYGDFPHSRGLQRVNRAAAEAMVARFNSFRGRLGRLFGGAPFYVGHPDLPNTSELVDRKAYGWVMRLEAREDGLYGQVKWSEAGLELLKNAHFKYFSPYWEAKEVGSENGRRVYQPVALVSVGLTNQPNIPVRPLANESSPDGPHNTGDVATDSSAKDESAKSEPENLEQEPAEGTENSIAANTNGLSVGPVPPPGISRNGTEITGKILAHNVEERRAEDSAPYLESATKDGLSVGPVPSPGVSQAPPRLRNARRRRLRLQNMHTRSVTENIGERRTERVPMANMERRRDRIHEAVQARMRLGLSYNDAWASVKRERREWFIQ